MNGIIEHIDVHLFSYIFLFCSLFFLTTAIFVKKIWFRIIYIILFSIFIALGVTEFVLYFSMRPAEIESVKDNQFEIDNKKEVIRCARFIDKYKRDFFCFNENIDFELKNSGNEMIGEAKYSIFTNDFRQTACNLNGEKAYVFLGCSFTFGEFLNDNETLPYNFSKLLNFESNVLNCGVRGHGSNRALSILNSGIINRINNNAKTEHFFYSLISDHIRRNFRVAAGDSSSDNWLYKDGKWTRVSQPFGNIKVLFAKSYIFRKIFVDLIEKKYSNFYAYYLIDSLAEIDKIIKDKYNSKLTIVVWPEFTEKFISKLKETNMDLVFLPKDFRKYEKGYYEHPNPKSNEEIAEILYNHINKK